MKMPEPTMPPITSIVASNNPRRAARVGRASVCGESACASRDGVLSDKKERVREICRGCRKQAARIYHSYLREPSAVHCQLHLAEMKKAADRPAALVSRQYLQCFALYSFPIACRTPARRATSRRSR